MAGWTELIVVDGDGHVVEPGDLWTARMDHARWGDWIPRRELVDDVYPTNYLGGRIRGGGREMIDAICTARGITPRQFREIYAKLEVAGGSDPKSRLADMDRDGIDAAVLYPSHALFFGPVDPIPALHDVAFVLACQQAYNDWIVEYCDAAPDRLFALGCAPLQDVALAVTESERVAALGLRGVMIRPSPYVAELPLSHRVYDPFWSACQDLDLTVALHPGVHTDTPGACRKLDLVKVGENMAVSNAEVDEVHGGSALGQAVGNAVDMIVSMGRLLMGGVCERFPRLTFVFLESGGGWCGPLLERMDEQVKTFPLERRWLSMLPGEYFRRQCYISFEPGEATLASSAEHMGADRIIWASDYPHPEYEEHVVDELMANIKSLDHATQRRIVGDNARQAYRLPTIAKHVPS